MHREPFQRSPRLARSSSDWGGIYGGTPDSVAAFCGLLRKRHLAWPSQLARYRDSAERRFGEVNEGPLLENGLPCLERGEASATLLANVYDPIPRLSNMIRPRAAKNVCTTYYNGGLARAFRLCRDCVNYIQPGLGGSCGLELSVAVNLRLATQLACALAFPIGTTG